MNQVIVSCNWARPANLWLSVLYNWLRNMLKLDCAAADAAIALQLRSNQGGPGSYNF
jgi:hypothetical protein